MGAFHTLALALAPRFIQHVILRREASRTDIPALRMARPLPAHAPRYHALSCHWERAVDGSLVAHWVTGGEDPSSREAPDGRACALLREVPRGLIDAARNFERRGFVPALIAMSRMARMNQARGFRR
jgi:hypothetical protein